MYPYHRRRLIRVIGATLAAMSPFRLSDAAPTERVVSLRLKDKLHDEVRLQAGEALAVRLPVQIGTGFVWHLVELSRGSSIVTLTRVDLGEENGDNELGRPQVQVFHFRADKEGRADLEFLLSRDRYRLAAEEKVVVSVIVE